MIVIHATEGIHGIEGVSKRLDGNEPPKVPPHLSFTKPCPATSRPVVLMPRARAGNASRNTVTSLQSPRLYDLLIKP